MSQAQADQAEFARLVGEIAGAIGNRPLDAQLEAWLNATYPASNATFQKIAALIAQGDKDGWICQREAGGIRFCRPVKPHAEAGHFSVDVVFMKPVRGGRHTHPLGEIGMIIPTDGTPKFDGVSTSWYVYGPGTSHHPTMTDGSAYVLYLLPEGSIEFERA